MTIKYNAPTTLSFTFISAGVLLLGSIMPGLVEHWFSIPGRGGFDAGNVLGYVRLFTHVLGHANMEHFLSNFSFILLLGPMLETTYGSTTMLIMTVVTAFVTGLLNILLFPTGLLGASGIVFMMILLSSFTNFTKGEVPLTFILILLLYLGREVLNALKANDISEFAHIIGGLCGSVFGYLKPSKR